MLKLIGIILIFNFSVITGVYFSEFQKKKRNVCRELVGVIEYLSNEIPRKRAVNDIIADVCRGNKYLRTSDKKDLSCKVKMLLSDGSVKEIAEYTETFLDGIGRGLDVHSECEACIGFLNRIKPLCESLERESMRCSGLYSKLGALCGLILCILVI